MKTIDQKCQDANSQAPFPIQDSSGKLYKNLCIVLVPADQPTAMSGCAAGYMHLLQIDSDFVQTFILALMDQVFSGSGYPYLARVDGVRDPADKKWYYSSKGTKVEAWAGLKWLVNSDTFTGYDTLVVTNLAYPVNKAFMKSAIDGVPSNEGNSLYLCEY